ncbi:hypothetical protein F3Y22_tig00111877pilonHSYRG00298 [Hibiscus syriacus]|uniref:Uncharacterized protein n=1 Tax=Hibiscus syriacus TaxID=106335 RepID=A0A6A2YDV4_HIBSY|nr:hypothetical protein F3Y22_tig00111877pilonHSYRG00298 [Hibiscus syriacus]
MTNRVFLDIFDKGDVSNRSGDKRMVTVTRVVNFSWSLSTFDMKDKLTRMLTVEKMIDFGRNYKEDYLPNYGELVRRSRLCLRLKGVTVIHLNRCLGTILVKMKPTFHAAKPGPDTNSPHATMDLLPILMAETKR